jgi:hypothetical protein
LLGKANMQGFREQYLVARVDFELREIRGSGDFWIGEGRVRYDGAIWEPEDGLAAHVRGGG